MTETRFIKGQKQSVLQDWVMDLCSLRMQGTLISAIRGCDGVTKEDISKKFVRALRSDIMNSAAVGYVPKFIQFDVTEEDIAIFLKQPDQYPVHWLMHFIHAIEVIGYMHPIQYKSNWYTSLYFRLADMLHMNPESQSQFFERLSDGSKHDCWKS